MPKKNILFLCTHNSSRSQMAEGIVNKFLGDRYTAFSAGTEVTEVNSFAVKAMNEIGIDMRGHFSKHLVEFKGKQFDYIVTVCDSANESCPVYLKGENHIHKSFKDPAECKGSHKEKSEFFKIIRDEIKIWIEDNF